MLANLFKSHVLTPKPPIYFVKMGIIDNQYQEFYICL